MLINLEIIIICSKISNVQNNKCPNSSNIKKSNLFRCIIRFSPLIIKLYVLIKFVSYTIYYVYEFTILELWSMVLRRHYAVYFAE